MVQSGKWFVVVRKRTYGGKRLSVAGIGEIADGDLKTTRKVERFACHCCLRANAQGQSQPITRFMTRKSKKPSRKDWAFCLIPCGAGKRNRTPDLRITNALLYRLSYSGIRETRL
jgi:hypothetical protein